jgi:hypothetical protein
MQTWFELGLIGALLLCAVGLSIVAAIRGLAPRLQRYGLATFATTAAMASVSYGMWQAWFMASFGLCAALFVLGTRCLASCEIESAGCSRNGRPVSGL